MQVMPLFSSLSFSFGLSYNLYKRKIAGIGSLEGVDMALWGIKSVNLKNDTIKLLRIHFSFNNFIKEGHKISKSYIKYSAPPGDVFVKILEKHRSKFSLIYIIMWIVCNIRLFIP